VHIGSSDAFAPPVIDPRALDNEIDLGMMVDAIKFIRKVSETGDLGAIGRKEFLPGAEIQSDEQIREWVKSSVQGMFHPIGTASMLPREDGGVVDSTLKVYGTDNLRVVSLVPVKRFFFLLLTVSVSF
jgi:choline dehydrogenase-like flavoprotein